MTPPHSPPPLAWRVKDFCRAVHISKATFYNYMAAGRIRTIRIAGVRLIPADAVAEFLKGDPS
jgi:predicted site-specific integrase-resolvase